MPDRQADGPEPGETLMHSVLEFETYIAAHAYSVASGYDVDMIQTITYSDGRTVFGVILEGVTR